MKLEISFGKTKFIDLEIPARLKAVSNKLRYAGRLFKQRLVINSVTELFYCLEPVTLCSVKVRKIDESLKILWFSFFFFF